MRRLIFLFLAAAVVAASAHPVGATPTKAPTVVHPASSAAPAVFQPVSGSGPGITLSIPGESQELEIHSFSFGPTSGTLVMDKASPKLMQACVAGAHYPSVVLHNGAKWYKLTSFSFGSNRMMPMVAGKPQQMTLKFTYLKIEMGP
jgi:Type VI secretion system effector, Hcp